MKVGAHRHKHGNEKTEETFMNAIDLNGRTAVITGGAQGIGLAIAKRLAASGAALALWDRDPDTLREAAKQLPGSATLCDVDVSDPEAVQSAAESTAKEQGKIDI